MDSTVEIQPEIGSDDGVGEKRVADDVEMEEPAPKKARSVVIGNTKKVAEMVLVLAAMGKIRGGRVPADAEKEMMVEAREKLAQVCETFAPKDVFPRDAFGAVIEDLGLNKLKEQRLGFRPPKMSIAEKLMIAKEKLEKTEEFAVSAATYSSQRPQANMATAIENRGPSHVRMFPPDKASQVVNPSRSFQSASPLVHGTPASSAPLPYQLPTSEVRPVISSGVVSGNPVRDSSLVALPRVERPSFRMDGRTHGSPHMLQVQATSGDHSAIRTPTWSVQPASVPAAKHGPDNRVTVQTGNKVEGVADVKPQMTASRPFITRTTAGTVPTTHPHLQGTSFVKSPPLSNAHAEIGKIVQKFIQPCLSERPAWTPPSRDYMSKALTCQMCKSTINEIDNVLVCDACEKGYHLKCLQTTNQKGVPRGEWHCGRCLSMTNGKPLPPKYGRVMRNFNAPKISTITSAVQSSANKKASGLYEKIIQQKLTANGKVPLKNSPSIAMENSDRDLPSEPKMENEKEMGESIIVSGKENMESKDSMRSCSNNLTVSSSDQYLSTSAGSSVNRSCEEKVVELKPQAPVRPETDCHSSDSSQALNHLQTNDHAGVANTTAMPSKQFHETQPMVSDARESSRSNVGNLSSNESKKEKQAVEQINPAETAVATTEDAECSSSSSDHFQNVDWIGNVLQVADDKYYYQSCRINGFIYSVQDYALIRFENERLIPSKLLAMWEDKKAGTKWVTINQCYFARELPQSVGRPCLENSNEVYLSTYSSIVMAGLIQGPCEVHPPRKFTEESERRARLPKGSSDVSRPLHICKWIYDESKGLFRDVSF